MYCVNHCPQPGAPKVYRCPHTYVGIPNPHSGARKQFLRHHLHVKTTSLTFNFHLIRYAECVPQAHAEEKPNATFYNINWDTYIRARNLKTQPLGLKQELQVTKHHPSGLEKVSKSLRLTWCTWGRVGQTRDRFMIEEDSQQVTPSYIMQYSLIGLLQVFPS